MVAVGLRAECSDDSPLAVPLPTQHIYLNVLVWCFSCFFTGFSTVVFSTTKPKLTQQSRHTRHTRARTHAHRQDREREERREYITAYEILGSKVQNRTTRRWKCVCASTDVYDLFCVFQALAPHREERTEHLSSRLAQKWVSMASLC